MFKCRKLGTHTGLPLEIHLAGDDALARGQFAQYTSPAIDDGAVTIGFAAILVRAGLRRGHQMAQVFDGAGAQQQMPVCLAGGHGEGRRDDEQLRAGVDHAPEQLGKAQVVAHHHTQPADRRIEHADATPRHHAGGFAMALGRIGHIDVEQVDLVVATEPAAIRTINQTRGRHALLARHPDRKGSRHQREFQIAGGLGQRVLHRAIAIRFGNGALVPLAPGHQREILGQHGELRALARRLRQQPPGGRQIGGHIHARGHLHSRDVHASTTSY
jgi:hypothetical protein